jgi:hypothetical protein
MPLHPVRVARINVGRRLPRHACWRAGRLARRRLRQPAVDPTTSPRSKSVDVAARRPPERSNPAGDERTCARSIFARRDNVPPYLKTRSPVTPGMKVSLSVEAPCDTRSPSARLALRDFASHPAGSHQIATSPLGHALIHNRCRVCQDPTPFSHKAPIHPRSVFSRRDRP